jgi:hypothetical protein
MLGFGTDDLSFGFGGRVGKTFANGLYLGASFIYHTGLSQDEGAFQETISLFYTGFEGGYDLNLRYVTVRPYLGLGFADVTQGNNLSNTLVTNSTPYFAAWPAVQVEYDIPHSIFFVGADIRLLIIASGPGPVFATYVGGGVKFGGD